MCMCSGAQVVVAIDTPFHRGTAVGSTPLPWSSRREPLDEPVDTQQENQALHADQTRRVLLPGDAGPPGADGKDADDADDCRFGISWVRLGGRCGGSPAEG